MAVPHCMLSMGSLLFYTLLVFVQGLVLLVAAIIAYRLTLHPLSSVPGPKLAAISNIWYAYHARNGLVHLLGKTLHEQYGPVVRVGPNELWFNTKEAFDAIYGTGSKGLDKSDFYLALCLLKPKFDTILQPTFPDTLDLLSERNMKRYRLQRRLIGPVYRKDSVNKYEQAIDETLKRVVKRLKELDSAEVNLKQWMHIIAVECLGASVLSWSPGMLAAGTDWNSSNHSYLGWRRKTVFGLFPFMAKIDMCSKKLGRAFANLWGVTFQPPAGFRTFFPDVSRRVNRRTKAAADRKGKKHGQADLMADLIQLHHDKADFTEIYLRKMAITNFGAGHETMASTLTSVMAMLGSHQDVQAKARSEILDGHGSGPYSSVIPLDYTRAATKEAMRLYPVIAMSLPRESPAGGLLLHGYFIPGGTTIGCNPVSLHRNERISGPRPNEFRPERWLTDENLLRNMDRYNLSWGGGSRTCPGRHLAEMIVVKTITMLIEHFRVEVDMKNENVQPSYFLSMMTGISARFVPIE